MEKRESVRFFVRFLLLSLISIVNVVICLSIVTKGPFFEVLAGILAIGNVFFLIFMLVKSITMFIGHLFDKNKKRFELLYFINIIFAAFVTGLYLFFYFVLIMGLLIILLPFLA